MREQKIPYPACIFLYSRVFPGLRFFSRGTVKNKVENEATEIRERHPRTWLIFYDNKLHKIFVGNRILQMFVRESHSFRNQWRRYSLVTVRKSWRSANE